MRYNNILSISLQQMQIFLKCYDLRNFSRVAKEYNFTPSMISKTIQILEDILGIPLFIRKYHQLDPTPEADELYRGWSKALKMAENSIFRASEVHDTKKEDQVRIGLLETTRFCADYVSFKLDNDKEELPMDRIIWERRDMHSLAGALMNDEFDLVITWSGELPYFDEEKIIWRKIFSSPDALFVPASHPLFVKGIRSFSECRPYSFITLSPNGYPHYYSYLESLCHTFGFTPIISTVCGSTDSARYNLSLGRGLYVAPSLICSDWENEEVRKIEFEGGSSSDLIVVWKAENRNPLIKKIVYLITH